MSQMLLGEQVNLGSYQYQEISGAVAAEGLMGFWGVVADAC